MNAKKYQLKKESNDQKTQNFTSMETFLTACHKILVKMYFFFQTTASVLLCRIFLFNLVVYLVAGQ